MNRTDGIPVPSLAVVRQALLQVEVLPLTSAWRPAVDALAFSLSVFPPLGVVSVVTARHVPYGEYAGVRLDVS